MGTRNTMIQFPVPPTRARGTDENFRTFRTGPQSEKGGTIACTRIQSEDSASTESEAG